jgi:hypothetical protein
VARYPDRFAGALTFDYTAEDLDEQVATFRQRPGMLAGRKLVGNARDATLRPEFGEGKFERLYVAAERRSTTCRCSFRRTGTRRSWPRWRRRIRA